MIDTPDLFEDSEETPFVADASWTDSRTAVMAASLEADLETFDFLQYPKYFKDFIKAHPELKERAKKELTYDEELDEFVWLNCDLALMWTDLKPMYWEVAQATLEAMTWEQLRKELLLEWIELWEWNSDIYDEQWVVDQDKVDSQWIELSTLLERDSSNIIQYRLPKGYVWWDEKNFEDRTSRNDLYPEHSDFDAMIARVPGDTTEEKQALFCQMMNLNALGWYRTDACNDEEAMQIVWRKAIETLDGKKRFERYWEMAFNRHTVSTRWVRSTNLAA